MDLLSWTWIIVAFEEQVNIFAKADVVMAEHGAALVNAIFMKPSASLIEIFPIPMIGRFMYRMISNNFKLNYLFGSMTVAPKIGDGTWTISKGT